MTGGADVPKSLDKRLSNLGVQFPQRWLSQTQSATSCKVRQREVLTLGAQG